MKNKWCNKYDETCQECLKANLIDNPDDMDIETCKACRDNEYDN